MKFKFVFFNPFEIHEVMAHGRRKTLQIVSFLHFGRLAKIAVSDYELEIKI
jgi:hypothetical protein